MSTLQDKKVSVIVPNFNYGQYIKKRIKSILKQTYPIYEVIILDDASTDGSEEIIEKSLAELGKKYPKVRMKFVKNIKNTGKAILQWEKGIEMAEGDYVWIAEADDLSNCKFLEEVMKPFDDPEVVISYTESRIINSKGIIVAPNFRWSRDKEKTGHFKSSYVKSGREEIGEIMAIRCTIPNVSAAVFRRDGLTSAILSKSAEFSQAGDWYLYLKLLEKGKVSYNRKALNYFRVHSSSVTDKAKKSKKHLDEIEYIQKMVREKYPLSESVIKNQKNEYERVKQRMLNN